MRIFFESIIINITLWFCNTNQLQKCDFWYSQNQKWRTLICLLSREIYSVIFTILSSKWYNHLCSKAHWWEFWHWRRRSAKRRGAEWWAAQCGTGRQDWCLIDQRNEIYISELNSKIEYIPSNWMSWLLIVEPEILKRTSVSGIARGLSKATWRLKAVEFTRAAASFGGCTTIENWPNYKLKFKFKFKWCSWWWICEFVINNSEPYWGWRKLSSKRREWFLQIWEQSRCTECSGRRSSPSHNPLHY